MTRALLMQPQHFECPYCGLRCVAGIVSPLGLRSVIHALPVCPEALQAGPAVILARLELAQASPNAN